jgi:hypothetical protein
MGKILGEKFKKYVIDQINQRQNAHGSGTSGKSRTLDQITYLNSNTSWVKLASGTRITPERTLEENIKSGYSWDSLAKQHILFGGVSTLFDVDNNKFTDVLRPRGTAAYEGEGNNIWSSYWGTYNVNASNKLESEFGLVPMPGITSVEVKCLNRGSIKKATVNMKCYSPEQFQIIDLLYLRIGYTVFLEWGNSLYLDDGKIVRQNFTLTEAETYGFFSDRWKDSSYAGFLPMIEAYRKDRKGNYDGLLAKIVNFSWTFSQDGSYDISLELISLGDVVESLKMNISPSHEMSKFVKDAYSLYSQDTIEDTDKDQVSSPSDNAITSYLFLQKIFIDEKNNPEGYDGGRRITNRQVTIRDNGTLLKLGGTFVTPPKSGIITLDPIYSDTPVFDTEKEVIDYVTANYDGYSNISNPIPSNDANIAALALYPENSFVIQSNWNYLDYYAAVKTVPDPLKIDPKLATKGDVVYMNYNEGNTDEDAPINDAGFYMRWGHLLQYINNKVIPIIKGTGKNGEGTQTKIVKINYDTWGNKMYTLPYQVSLDPRVCIVKSLENINNKEYFPELDPFRSSKYNFAWPMNIYLSHNQIIASLNENLDEKGNIALFDFLNSLCIAVNKAMGGINNLEPFLDEDTNTLYIIDASYQPKITPEPYVLELYGYNGDQSGFVRNFNLKTEITNDFATMASVGSTAGGYVKGTENTMFSKWNKGLIDKWKESYEPAEVTSRPIPGSVDEPLKEYTEEFWNKSYPAFGYTLMDIADDTTFFGGYGDMAGMSDDVIDSNVAIVTEFYKYAQSKIQENQFNQSSSYSSPSNGFIPINLGITMDGISGIKIYNEVNVDTRFLPQNYPDNLRFIIKGVNHKLENSDWETSIETVVISNSTDKKTKTPLTYDKIKAIIDNLLSESSLFSQIFGGTTTSAPTRTRAVSGVASSGIPTVGSQQARATAQYGPPPQEGGTIPLVTFWTPYPLFYSGAQVKNSQTATNKQTKKTIKVKLSELTWDRTNKHWTDPNGVYGDVNATYTTPKDKLIMTFKVHKDEKLSIEKCYIDIKKEYGLEKIYELGLNTCSGTYVPRNIRGGNTYSMHSWGTAIDILAGLNGLKTKAPQAQFSKPEYKKFLDIMENNGWYSLGKRYDYDYMHFQTTKP